METIEAINQQLDEIHEYLIRLKSNVTLAGIINLLEKFSQPKSPYEFWSNILSTNESTHIVERIAQIGFESNSFIGDISSLHPSVIDFLYRHYTFPIDWLTDFTYACFSYNNELFNTFMKKINELSPSLYDQLDTALILYTSYDYVHSSENDETIPLREMLKRFNKEYVENSDSITQFINQIMSMIEKLASSPKISYCMFYFIDQLKDVYRLSRYPDESMKQILERLKALPQGEKLINEVFGNDIEI